MPTNRNHSQGGDLERRDFLLHSQRLVAVSHGWTQGPWRRRSEDLTTSLPRRPRGLYASTGRGERGRELTPYRSRFCRALRHRGRRHRHTHPSPCLPARRAPPYFRPGSGGVRIPHLRAIHSSAVHPSRLAGAPYDDRIRRSPTNQAAVTQSGDNSDVSEHGHGSRSTGEGAHSRP